MLLLFPCGRAQFAVALQWQKMQCHFPSDRGWGSLSLWKAQTAYQKSVTMSGPTAKPMISFKHLNTGMTIPQWGNTQCTNHIRCKRSEPLRPAPSWICHHNTMCIKPEGLSSWSCKIHTPQRASGPFFQDNHITNSLQDLQCLKAAWVFSLDIF